MKTYFDVVSDFVGIENICNGPSNGPVSEIKFINGFVNIPTEEQIQAKIIELQAEYDAKQYQRDRAEVYPSWQDQLDTIYHAGIDAWKAQIKAIKTQHPKPE